MTKKLDSLILAAVIILLLIVVASCAPTSAPQTPLADPSTKPIVHLNTPQAQEQCAAQPELAWCRPHKAQSDVEKRSR